MAGFSDSIPKFYDSSMGPFIFEPFARYTAARIPVFPGIKLLEIGAGTGRLTRQLIKALPPDGTLVALDLHPDMLQVAVEQMRDPHPSWIIANALSLPLRESSFDVAIAQFSVMFYSDKLQGHREAHRVLRPRGLYLFTVWASPDLQPWWLSLRATIQAMLPDDPPSFSGPFSYHDEAEVLKTVEQAGFVDVNLERVTLELICDDARSLAVGMVAGSPLSTALSKRGIVDFEPFIDRVAEDLRDRLGDRPLRSTMTALMVRSVKQG